MKQISYEEAIKELNLIISKLESGQAAFDESLLLVEKGKELVSICYNSLSKAKGKLTEIKESLGKLEEF